MGGMTGLCEIFSKIKGKGEIWNSSAISSGKMKFMKSSSILEPVLHLINVQRRRRDGCLLRYNYDTQGWAGSNLCGWGDLS